MEISNTSPDDHLASLDDAVRTDMELLDREIVARMPGASRVLWEGKMWGGTDQAIIGYGHFSYTNSSGKDVEWFMVGLARQKNYISMYVNAVGEGGYLLNEYKDKLGKVKTGSASISFDSVDNVNLDTLMEMVGKAGDQLSS